MDNNLGWVASNEQGDTYIFGDFPESHGHPSSWSQFVDYLVEFNHYIKTFGLTRYPFTDIFWLPANACYYSFHYDLSFEVGASATLSSRAAVGIAVISPNTAAIRRVVENGPTDFSVKTDLSSLNLMKPSPFNYDLH